jgi:hypothetical protein
MRPFQTMGRMAFWQTHGPWLIAALLSVLAHTGLLALWGGHRVAGKPGAHTLLATLHIVGVPSRTLAAARAPSGVATPAAVHASAPVATEAVEAVETTPAAAAPQVQEPDGSASALDTYYFAAEELTAKPMFLRDKGAPSPTAMPDVLPLPVLAQVFIDEQGEVVQVVLSDNFLSDPARTFIVDSFLATQFTPGRMGALAVKSRLTIEVRLDPALPSR